MLFRVAGIYAQPTVSSHTPTQYQQNVSAGSDIVVTFSENINGATIDANSFNVDGDACGKIAGFYSTTGAQVTFNPTADFKAGELVTVTLTTGIENTGGDTLEDDYTWQFTVESAVAGAVFVEREISTTAEYENSAVNIRALVQRFSWDLCNLNGEPVSPGTYKAVAILRSKDGDVKKFTSLIGVER